MFKVIFFAYVFFVIFHDLQVPFYLIFVMCLEDSWGYFLCELLCAADRCMGLFHVFCYFWPVLFLIQMIRSWVMYCGV